MVRHTVLCVEYRMSESLALATRQFWKSLVADSSEGTYGAAPAPAPAPTTYSSYGSYPPPVSILTEIGVAGFAPGCLRVPEM